MYTLLPITAIGFTILILYRYSYSSLLNRNIYFVNGLVTGDAFLLDHFVSQAAGHLNP